MLHDWSPIRATFPAKPLGWARASLTYDRARSSSRADTSTTFQGVSACTRGRHHTDGLGYVPPSFGRKFREEALPDIIPRNTKTLGFPGLSLDSGGRIETPTPDGGPRRKTLGSRCASSRRAGRGRTRYAYTLPPHWPDLTDRGSAEVPVTGQLRPPIPWTREPL